MDAWIYDYERATQTTSEISANINEYHKQTTDSVQNAKLSASIRRSLVQLTKDIAALEDALRASTQMYVYCSVGGVVVILSPKSTRGVIVVVIHIHLELKGRKHGGVTY